MNIRALFIAAVLIQCSAQAFEPLPLRYSVNEPGHHISTNNKNGIVDLAQYLEKSADKCTVDIFNRFLELENHQTLQNLRDRISASGRDMRLEVLQSAAVPAGALKPNYTYALKIVSWPKNSSEEISTVLFSFLVNSGDRCAGMMGILNKKDVFQIDEVTVRGLIDLHKEKPPADPMILDI